MRSDMVLMNLLKCSCLVTCLPATNRASGNFFVPIKHLWLFCPPRSAFAGLQILNKTSGGSRLRVD